MPMPSGSVSNTTLRGVWGSAWNDVFAVGGYLDAASGSSNSVILHYDGVPSQVITTSTSTTTTPVSTTTPPITTTTAEPSCPSESIYGEHSEQTELLRYIRDNVLAQTPEGREIIKLYYQWSPVIVRAMEGDEEVKEDVKDMIDGVLELIVEEAE